MAEFLSQYGLFLLKMLTVVGSVLLLVVGVVVIASARRSQGGSGSIEVESINSRMDDYRDEMLGSLNDDALMDAAAKLKKQQKKSKHKADKKKAKQLLKAKDAQGIDEAIGSTAKPRVFVLDFDGDIQAHAVDLMREEISAILTVAGEGDAVLLRLESGGGMVHAYGLAAAQLARLTARGLKLTVCIDKVAASGGYMMACVAHKIIAAPFAIVGSIGVVAQLPNFNRLLKKHDIDYELYTAGEYKRTLTMLGENTDEGRAKFKQELEETHTLFKDHVANYRPVVDIAVVANGDVWYGTQALENHLIDEIATSDAYINGLLDSADVYSVRYVEKQSLGERISKVTELGISRACERALNQILKNRFF